MRIWLITIGEPLPSDGGDDRLLRTGILTTMLADKAHDVVWWTSTFDHIRKRQRYETDRVVRLGDRVAIRMLHSIGYRKNISVGRLVNHRGIARKFATQAPLEPPPGVILCSLPTVELCVAATRYGRKHGVPVVLDVRDLWPDLFLELAPVWSRRAVSVLLAPIFREVREACSGATAIFGVTEDFVAWGTRYAGRAASALDGVFPMAYVRTSASPEHLTEAATRWRARGVEEGRFVICFFGTIGRHFDLDTVVGAARKLKDGTRAFQFVICGSGDRLEFHRKQAADCPNVLFPGWVNRADIRFLMQVSSAGLAPYVNRPNFTMNLPNKPLEYISAGLPVVSSLRGTVKKLLMEHGCGITYEEKNSDSLSEALIHLHDHRETLSEMSRNARALFESRFDAETVYGRMIEQLERLTETPRTPG